MAALLFAAPAQAAPPVVLSAAPDEVAVTLYRDPDRGDGAINRAQPTSFALIVETRTVTLPPGETVVRFEGVASGIVPQSAMLFGTDPRERNRDAALLSQRGLVDAFTGQQVIIKRTDPATGKVTEETATVRSAADRLVISTERGAEAVYCSGLDQTLIYPGVPASLSAKPVLSMTTRDQSGGRTTITLAYLATGFDWDATYVGTLGDDGRSLSLLGWMTMASGDDTSFADARTAAVAGRINRSADTRDDTGRIALDAARNLNRRAACWPAKTTSDTGVTGRPRPPGEARIVMELAAPMAAMDIVVSGRRREDALAKAAVVAGSEALGDLKLYTIPVPVTVAARSQKQVAFLVKDRIAGSLIYRARIDDSGPGDQPQLMFRFRNRKQDGAGDALPAGKWVLYQDGRRGRMYIGESSLADKAVDEEAEVVFGRASNVSVQTEAARETDGKAHQFTVTVSNANPFPVRFELDFPRSTDRVFSMISGKIVEKPAKRVWTATIPANNKVQLTYRAAAAD